MITLRQARLNKDLTQSKVAKKIKMSNANLINIEKNRCIPNATTFLKLCNLYGIDPREVIFLTKNQTKSCIKKFNSKSKPRERKSKKSHSTI